MLGLVKKAIPILCSKTFRTRVQQYGYLDFNESYNRLVDVVIEVFGVACSPEYRETFENLTIDDVFNRAFLAEQTSGIVRAAARVWGVVDTPVNITAFVVTAYLKMIRLYRLAFPVFCSDEFKDLVATHLRFKMSDFPVDERPSRVSLFAYNRLIGVVVSLRPYGCSEEVRKSVQDLGRWEHPEPISYKDWEYGFWAWRMR
jgi:hypothetical protein